MAKDTGIQWTDSTWNPWYGCNKVSEGCKNCYMFRDLERYGMSPTDVTRSKTKFTDPYKWKKPRRIFTCSWSDFFIEQADGWRPEAWAIIKATPWHTYQILTKRPERIRECLPPDWDDKGYPNVWLGVSLELSTRFYRLQELFDALYSPNRAYKCFISAEPLLGPLIFCMIM